MKRIFLTVLILGLITVIFATGFFLEKKSITKRGNFLAALIGENVSEEMQLLKMENEALKAQIQKSQIFCFDNNSSFPTGEKNILKARVFSTYPFNVKHVLNINIGKRDGIKNGLPATFEKDLFIGQVSEVFDSFAKVRTVFDPDWQLTVKIGEEKINGLFKGGNEPKIILIEKTVKIGDPVFTAGPDTPLDLKIGDIAEIHETSGGVFKEAIVKIPYNISQLDSVNILIN